MIAIFGSGETSPAMTSVHQELIARVSDPQLNAVLLDTPFGFQEHADETAPRPLADNREGGTHDTRFCYMGEPRLRLLESMLPEDVLILGVDEYTACIIDFEAQSVTVRGRGGVTVRRRGIDRRWQRTTFALSELSHPQVAPAAVPDSASGRPEPDGTAVSPMLEQAREWGAHGRDALDRRDVDGVVAAILETENVLNAWAADLVGTDERDRVRAEMRNLVVRLGDLVRGGGREGVREYVAPLIDVLLSLRGEARREQRFKDADRLRAILAQCGVEVQDTPSGTAWSLQSQN